MADFCASFFHGQVLDFILFFYAASRRNGRSPGRSLAGLSEAGRKRRAPSHSAATATISLWMPKPYRRAALSLPPDKRAELADQLLCSPEPVSEAEIEHLWFSGAAHRAEESIAEWPRDILPTKRVSRPSPCFGER